MKREYIVRLMAGTLVLISAALVHFVSEWWLLLTCFVGLNLVQSAFTGFCPPEIFLKRMGWGKSSDDGKSDDRPPSCGCGR